MYRSLCAVPVLFAVLCSSSIIFDVFLPMKLCKDAQNLSNEAFTRIILQDITADVNDPKVQCFIACLLDKMGVLKSDGTVNTLGLINGLPQVIDDIDEVTEELRKCGDQPGEGCEKKYKIAVCIKRIEDRIASRTSD